MRKQYDQQLQKLHAELLHMGEMIQQAISGAVTALLEGDDNKAHEVIAFDGEIDQQERMIEQMCYKLLLSQQPVASDLRMVSSVLKMITDMERIGDHAADISELEQKKKHDDAGNDSCPCSQSCQNLPSPGTLDPLSLLIPLHNLIIHGCASCIFPIINAFILPTGNAEYKPHFH